MNEPACVYCRRASTEVPLVTLTYAGQQLYICPQHMPILIHDPGRLVDLMPGAEHLEPAEHRD